MKNQGIYLPYDLIDRIGCTAAMKLAMFHYKKAPMGRYTIAKLIREGILIKGEERVVIAPQVLQMLKEIDNG